MYHFAVIVYEDGIEQEPKIIDPIFGLWGKIRFVDNGFIYLPGTYVDYQQLISKYPQFRSWQSLNIQLEAKEDFARLIKGDYEILTTDELIRHINYINSPLGFFDYYKNGQIIEKVSSGYVNMEFSAQTIDDKLIVRGIFTDLFPCEFTFQRTYSRSDEGIRSADAKMLHLGYHWVRPLNVFYSDEEGGKLIHSCEEYMNSGATNFEMAFVHYIRSRSEKSKQCLHSPEERKDYIANYDKSLENIRKELRKDETNNEKISALKEKEESIVSFLGHLERLDSRARDLYIDWELFIKKYRERKIRIRKPYTSFREVEKVMPLMEEYLQMRDKILRPHIDSFFESEVVHELSKQYAESINLKRRLEHK
jgi:hypothetical protein